MLDSNTFLNLSSYHQILSKNINTSVKFLKQNVISKLKSFENYVLVLTDNPKRYTEKNYVIIGKDDFKRVYDFISKYGLNLKYRMIICDSEYEPFLRFLQERGEREEIPIYLLTNNYTEIKEGVKYFWSIKKSTKWYHKLLRSDNMYKIELIDTTLPLILERGKDCIKPNYSKID